MTLGMAAKTWTILFELCGEERATLSISVFCPLFLFPSRNLQAGYDSDVVVNF